MNDDERKDLREEKEKLSDEELRKDLESTYVELAARHNREQLKKMARLMAKTTYQMPKQRFTLISRYVTEIGADKMKVMIVIAKQDEFEEIMNRTTAKMYDSEPDMPDELEKYEPPRRTKIDID